MELDFEPLFEMIRQERILQNRVRLRAYLKASSEVVNEICQDLPDETVGEVLAEMMDLE